MGSCYIQQPKSAVSAGCLCMNFPFPFTGRDNRDRRGKMRNRGRDQIWSKPLARVNAEILAPDVSWELHFMRDLLRKISKLERIFKKKIEFFSVLQFLFHSNPGHFDFQASTSQTSEMLKIKHEGTSFFSTHITCSLLWHFIFSSPIFDFRDCCFSPIKKHQCFWFHNSWSPVFPPYVSLPPRDFPYNQCNWVLF